MRIGSDAMKMGRTQTTLDGLMAALPVHSQAAAADGHELKFTRDIRPVLSKNRVPDEGQQSPIDTASPSWEHPPMLGET